MMKNLMLPFILLAVVAAGVAYYSQSPPVAIAQISPSVTVKTIEPQKIRTWSEFSGRLQAVDTAEIRPQVSGRITKVLCSLKMESLSKREMFFLS